MAFGLSETGLLIPTVAELREIINERYRERFGVSQDVSDGSIAGRYNGIMAEQLGLLWEQLEVVNSSQNPDAATGTGLIDLAALTGTIPREASGSTVTLTLTGTPATVVDEGSRAATASTDVLFATDEDATITLLDDWEADTVYATGDRVTNDDKAYVCTEGGTSDSSGGPDTEDEAIVDNTVTWRFMGEGTGAVDVESTAVETGPQVALSGDVTVIDTPVGGWSSVINLLDADLGEDEETDAELRARREDELTAAGSTTAKAIRTALLGVEDVTAVTIFVNNTDTTDDDGVPPHAIEAMVTGGDDQDIFDTLFDNVAAGIQTYGGEEGTATDDEGVEHDVEFSRPEEIEIYLEFDVVKDPLTFPIDGADQIEAAIIAYGDAQKTGRDAIATALMAQVYSITGVLDVPADAFFLDVTPAPSSTANIEVTSRQKATYDTSRITINLTDGTP